MERSLRFRSLGPGCFLYALFYTFCLYHNTAGITYPFFVGGTLWFFCSYSKKFVSSSAKEGALIDKRILMVAIFVAGALNCMTDSWVLLFLNKLLMSILVCILMFQTWYDITGWSIAMHLKAWCHMACGATGRIVTPIADFVSIKKEEQLQNDAPEKREKKKRIIHSVTLGLLICIPLVPMILVLLGSADAVFGQMLYDVFLDFTIDAKTIDNISTFVKIVIEVAVIGGLAYGVFTYFTNKECKESIEQMASASKTNFDVYIAMTVNVIICVIYVIFSFIQIFGLFLGKMTLPEGYTYASYARRGFFELVFVCLFNILLVLCTLAYFERTKALKGILTVISICTYIMVASSAFRMILYISEYSLTFLRLFVLWALLVISLVMVGVLGYIYDSDFKLMRYMVVTLMIGYLVFSAVHPDYWIARYNLAQSEGADTCYLEEQLSFDAAPAFADHTYLQENYHVSSRLEKYKDVRDSFMGFRCVNLSREYALNKSGM